MSAAQLHTTCNRDCPDACGLVVSVDGDRVQSITGDPAHPITRGFVCYRTRQFVARQHDPSRLTTPLLRDGSGFRPIGWEQALDVAARELVRIRAESGPAAIVHYRSGGSLGLLKGLVDHFFAGFGPVTTVRGSACCGAGRQAQALDFGVSDSHDLLDLRHARTILLWGKNPKVSQTHLVPILTQARRGGTRVVLIDPAHHASFGLAHYTIQPKPGTDAELAMAVARLLLDRGWAEPKLEDFCDGADLYLRLLSSRTVEQWAAQADVAMEDVSMLADALHNRPCAILAGWGMVRRSRGASILRALDALCAFSGNLGIAGGGIAYGARRQAGFDPSIIDESSARSIREPMLGQDILQAQNPPVRAVWITAGNPVAMLPDSSTVEKALRSRELVVVVDSFMTDTARRATLVLPTKTLLEDDDLIPSYGHHWIGVSRPVVRPPAEVYSDLEIIQLLAARIDALAGSNLHCSVEGSAASWKRRMLAGLSLQGLSLEALEQGPKRRPDAPEVLFADRRFPTPSGKMQLLTELTQTSQEPADYPLWLFSSSTRESQCAQWVGPPPEFLVATCHPDAAPGMTDGQRVFLQSELGMLSVKLRLDDLQRRDVVIVAKGGHFDSGACANALIAAKLTDAGEGAAYLDCRVRLVAQ